MIHEAYITLNPLFLLLLTGRLLASSFPTARDRQSLAHLTTNFTTELWELFLPLSTGLTRESPVLRHVLPTKQQQQHHWWCVLLPDILRIDPLSNLYNSVLAAYTAFPWDYAKNWMQSYDTALGFAKKTSH